MTETARVTPQDFGLPHTEWRKSQREIGLGLSEKPDGSVIFLSAPTGSGKTSYAKMLGTLSSVTSLVKTKSLQEHNYGEIYDFDILYGRGNYPCVHPDRAYPDLNADQCMYELKMEQCEYAAQCPYLIQKQIVKASNVRSLNYAYFLTSRWPRKKEYATEFGVYDECHILPDETLEFVGCTIKDTDRLRWRLPEFPSCYESSRDSVNLVLTWLEQSIGVLEVTIAQIKGDEPDDKAKKSRAERLAMKLKFTCTAIHRSGDDWYVRSGQRALENIAERKPGLVIKPLTARFHFPSLFLNVFPKTIMMSATVGNVEDLAEELGVEKYDYERVPNQWPPESRPVHVLDVPPMGYSAKDSAKELQAKKMANVLNELPQDWSGIIHTTSWKQTAELKSRLNFFGVSDHRLFIPTRGQGTNAQMTEWNIAKRPGMIVITPSMNAGVDLLQERICLIAKTPFPFCQPGSYEYERMLYSNRFYRWQTAADLEQRAGRTRRGRPEDYDDSFNVRGYVGIFDGAFRKMGLAKSCSKDFNESLVYD